MPRNRDRILTTHAGSLPRPPDLTRMMWDLLDEKPVDEAHLQARVKQAVADVVARQREAGVDIVSDGEMSKVGFSNYVMQRYSGFANRAQFVATDLGDFPEIVNKLFVENEGGRHLVHAQRRGPDRAARQGGGLPRHRQPQGGARGAGRRTPPSSPRSRRGRCCSTSRTSTTRRRRPISRPPPRRSPSSTAPSSTPASTCSSMRPISPCARTAGPAAPARPTSRTTCRWPSRP